MGIDRREIRDPEQVQAYDLGQADASSRTPAREGLDVGFLAAYRAGYEAGLEQLRAEAEATRATAGAGEDDSTSGLKTGGMHLAEHVVEHVAEGHGHHLPPGLGTAYELATEAKSDQPELPEWQMMAEHAHALEQDLDRTLEHRVEEQQDPWVQATEHGLDAHPEAQDEPDASVPDASSS
jgi:hypothetical protein